jgi:hypothetical protein
MKKFFKFLIVPTVTVIVICVILKKQIGKII